jgi:hypothetical protein
MPRAGGSTRAADPTTCDRGALRGCRARGRATGLGSLTAGAGVVTGGTVVAGGTAVGGGALVTGGTLVTDGTAVGGGKLGGAGGSATATPDGGAPTASLESGDSAVELGESGDLAVSEAASVSDVAADAGGELGAGAWLRDVEDGRSVATIPTTPDVPR